MAKEKPRHRWLLSPIRAFGVYDWYHCPACKTGDYHNRGKHKRRAAERSKP